MGRVIILECGFGLDGVGSGDGVRGGDERGGSIPEVSAVDGPRTGRPPSVVRGLSIPERLTTVATRMFAVRGFEGTTVQELVEATGITKGGFYHYFSSKDDLLREIYSRLLAEQAARLETVAEGPGDAADRLRLVASDVVATTLADIEAVTVVARSMHLLAPDVQATVRADRRRYHDRFCDLILDGQQSGEFRPDVTPDLVADFFFGAVHYLPVWFHADGPLSAEEVGAHFAELLVSSVRHPTMRSANSE